MSAVSYGLVVTPNVYFWNEAGGAKSDANAYFTYVGVTWTPPLGSEGREYKMCFTASDQLSSSTLCAVLPVVRCMYCTKSAETLKEVAERFSTNWLQVGLHPTSSPHHCECCLIEIACFKSGKIA